MPTSSPRRRYRRRCKEEISLSVPLVVRLEGTNVEQGKEILAKSGLAKITSANNLAGMRPRRLSRP